MKRTSTATQRFFKFLPLFRARVVMAQRRPWIEQQVESKQLLAHVATTFFRVQGSSKKLVPWLRECCRQSQVVVVCNRSNKLHQTWGPPFKPIPVHGPQDSVIWSMARHASRAFQVLCERGTRCGDGNGCNGATFSMSRRDADGMPTVSRVQVS